MITSSGFQAFHVNCHQMQENNHHTLNDQRIHNFAPLYPYYRHMYIVLNYHSNQKQL